MGVWHDIDTAFLGKRGIVMPKDYVDRISAMSLPKAAAHTIERFKLPDSVESLL